MNHRLITYSHFVYIYKCHLIELLYRIKDLLKQENILLKQIINLHKNLKNDIILIVRGDFYV